MVVHSDKCFFQILVNVLCSKGSLGGVGHNITKQVQ